MRKKNTGGIFLLALLGAAITTFCDGVHIHTRTLAYTHPFWFGQPWWVYPNFVLAFLLMGYGYLFLVDRLPAMIETRKSTSQGNARELIETLITFALVYLLSGFGNFEPVCLSFIFYGTFAVRLIFSYDRIWLLLLAFLMAVGGMFAEGVIAAAGLMKYRCVDIFYVPFWLGGLYLHGAFALREGLRFFVYTSKNQTFI